MPWSSAPLRLISSVAVASFALALAAGCGDAFVEIGSPAGAAGPTYHADVAPILRESCEGCHHEGGLAPFSLSTYGDAKLMAGLLGAVTRDGTMPPFGADETPECQPKHPWQDDPRLDEGEISTLEAWHAAGAPEGDAKTNLGEEAGEDAPLDEFELAGFQLELTPKSAFVTSGEGDQFRCFVLDPKLAADTFLNGAQVIPGNATVVHHAVLFADPSGASEALADASGSYDCFGGAGAEGSEIIDVWVPGSPPREYPSNVGIPLVAGSRLVLQIHYHPAGKVADPDVSRLQLRFVDAPEYRLVTFGFGNFDAAMVEDNGGIGELLPGPNDSGGVEFRIPANVADHTETMRFTLGPGDDGPEPDIFIYGAFNHMHYVGTDMRMMMKHSADGSEQCLLHTPRWDFAWQRFYAYDRPIEELSRVAGNDSFELFCKYDNSVENPYAMRALKEQGLMEPIEVHMGEETLDEMCVGAVQVVVRFSDL